MQGPHHPLFNSGAIGTLLKSFKSTRVRWFDKQHLIEQIKRNFDFEFSELDMRLTWTFSSSDAWDFSWSMLASLFFQCWPRKVAVNVTRCSIAETPLTLCLDSNLLRNCHDFFFLFQLLESTLSDNLSGKAVLVLGLCF